MKTAALFILLGFLTYHSNAQCSSSCCKPASKEKSATVAFASLGSEAGFRDAHEAPLPVEYAAMGRMITFNTPDGKKGSAYFLPAKKQSKKYLFVFHELWGLNDWIRKQCDLFGDSLPDINIMALDLYDGKVASSRDEAIKLMQANDTQRSRSVISGALNFAGKEAHIATIGWCFGGGWSMQGALLTGNQLSGCVIYYGMPESDVNKLKSLNAGVLFIWPNKDQWINQKVKDEFVKNMNTAGKELTVKEYDADHAFANPSNPKYDKVAGDDALKNSLAFLRKSLSK